VGEMKKRLFIGGCILGLLIGFCGYIYGAKYESSSYDAQPVVLYGSPDGGSTIVPLKTDTDGGVRISLDGDLEMGDTPYSIDGGTNGLAFDPDNDDVNEITMDTAGKVGIGTPTPAHPLTISANNGTDFLLGIESPNDSANFLLLTKQSSGDYATVSLRRVSTSGDGWNFGMGYANNNFVITSRVSSVMTDRLAILPTGEVGIGTTTPAEALDVAGTIDCDELEVDGAGFGTGHITILAPSYTSVGQGTWSIQYQTTYLGGYLVNDTLPADGDNVSYKIYLAKGTYNMVVYYTKGGDRGIVDFDIDTTEVASIDTYASVETVNQRTEITNISIASSGIKTLKMRVDGQNASSVNYIICISAIVFYRTS
jgi:hypothetical protein